MDKMRSNRLSSFVLVLFLASATLVASCTVGLAQSEDYYYRELRWDYAGFHWTWSLSIPKSLYDTYRGVSVSQRVQNGVGGHGFLVTTRDSYVIMLANELHRSATEKGYGVYDEVSMILAFVQSLPYTSDSNTSGYDEYPRFPIETLVDKGGDCEDTSILFATITLILNYDTIFICPPNHCAVGIWGKNLQGSYYTYHDKTYYYCETTGDGWRIGQIPNKHRNVSAHLYTINENMQYDPDWLARTILIVTVGALAIVSVVLILYVVAKRVKKAIQESGQSSSSERSEQSPSIMVLVFCMTGFQFNRYDVAP